MHTQYRSSISTKFALLTIVCTIMVPTAFAQSESGIQSLQKNESVVKDLGSKANASKTLDWEKIVDALNLEGHVEGGFYRRTSEATQRDKIATPHGQRLTMTSIYYLLTTQSPIGHFHLNRSDINHFFHLGDAITYYLIFPDGHLETHILGSNLLAGEVMQLNVPGGVWKASKVTPNNTQYGYALIGEAVSPGFEYEDMTIGIEKDLLNQFPQHYTLISELSYQNSVLKPQ